MPGSRSLLVTSQKESAEFDRLKFEFKSNKYFKY